MFVSTYGTNAELAALIDQMLQPVAGARADIAPGPSVSLPAHQVLPVSMILHELATNAVKYGALSNGSGVVRLTWTTQDRKGEPHLLLDWREEGGPPVSRPERRGFGTRLIQHGAEAEGGQAEFDYALEGLRVRITLLLAQ